MHARWALTLQEFDFKVKYRKGPVNMSRNPQPETEDLTGAREHDDLPKELVVRDPEPVASVMLAWQAWAAADLPEGVEPLSVEEAGGELWEPGKPSEPENLPFPGNIDYGPPDEELPVPAEQGLGGKRARALTDIWEDEHSLRFFRDERCRVGGSCVREALAASKNCQRRQPKIALICPRCMKSQRDPSICPACLAFF
jgi:hypothetical protein